LTAFASPDWYSETDVLGKFHPKDSANFPKLETWFERMFDWIIKHQHDWSHFYGMLDYGDVQTRRDMIEGQWARFCCRWGWLNTEVDMYFTGFLQYLRTGERKYFDFAEAMARHHMDVDIINYHPDPKYIGMGHRHDIDHWGGGTGASHAWINGMVLYYYLTGYRRAFDVARMVGDYFLSDPIRWAKEGNASREAVNGWWGTQRLWEATGEEKYKIAADEAAAAYRQYQLPNGLWHKLMFGYMGAAVPSWYAISGNEDCKAILLALKDYSAGSVMQNALGNGAPFYAYQYHLTKDAKYLIPGYREIVMRAPEVPAEMDVEDFRQCRIDIVSGLPYLMKALVECQVNLDDYLEKPAYTPEQVNLLDRHVYECVDVKDVANSNPWDNPFRQEKLPTNPRVLQSLEGRRPLKEGEIGLQFSHPSDPLQPGYILVTHRSRYPMSPGEPIPDSNFVGYPFGTTYDVNHIPFQLIDPARNEGCGLIVLSAGEQVNIPIGKQTTRIHFLGHIYCQSSQRSFDHFADIEVAQYVINYADGTQETIPLRNNQQMEDFTSSPYARQLRLARNLAGRWGTGHVNTYSFEPKPLPIESIDFVDTGAAYRPALLGITLEVERQEDIYPTEGHRYIFGSSEGCFGAQAPKSGECGYGWTNPQAIREASDHIHFRRENELFLDLENGTYQIELAFRGSPSSIDLFVNKELRAKKLEVLKYLDRMALLTSVENGCLSVAFRVNAMLHPDEELFLYELAVIPKPDATYQIQFEPQPAIRFGWDDINGLSPSSFYSGIQNVRLSTEKTFLVDMPNGNYEVELDLSAWYPGHHLVVDIYAQDELVVNSLFLGEAQPTFTAEVTNGRLEIRIIADEGKTSSRAPRWEIHAMFIRPLN